MTTSTSPHAPRRSAAHLWPLLALGAILLGSAAWAGPAFASSAPGAPVGHAPALHRPSAHGLPHGALAAPRGHLPEGSRLGPASGAAAFAARHCDGVWPNVGGQALYDTNCYGHDEPGVSFYSDLPGSGGNVTWNVTLPVDRSATENQSNLYAAIWFGMTLQDPLGWLGQCYLELQFYPDSSWYQPFSTVNGNWVAAAYAWQIDLTNGYEDPCFFSPLFVDNNPGLGYLNMTQGDQVVVQMTGWSGSPYGENISVRDLTSGTDSSLNLFDYQANAPLDPAYSTNRWSDSLQWTPGGEPPVTFAFEIGHAANSYFPSNSSFGGCSPGAPPPTPTNPAVPCPSYDPSSWVNDTLQPWKIQPPVFSNGAATARPAQAEFTQDLGGSAAIVPLSNGACTGSVGSAYCTYPWYSYSCGVGAFEFGATDYPGVTSDFGQSQQYTTVNVSNGLNLGYFPPAPVAIPSCGSPSASIILGAGAGTAELLGRSVHNATSPFTGLGYGEYSLTAQPDGGQNFLGWTTTGGAAVDAPASPWATLTVSGNGTVTARFGPAAPPSTHVWFNDSLPAGTVSVYAGIEYTNGLPLATVANGGALDLAPGLYSVQANAPAGSNLTSFTSSTGGIVVAAAKFPFTWVWVTGAAARGTVLAEYTTSSATALLNATVVGQGTIDFGALRANASSPIVLASLPVGNYTASAAPAPGWSFLGWSGFGNAIQSDFAPATDITLQEGNTSLFATFGADVEVGVSPASAGTVLIGGPGPWANGTSTALAPGTYKLDALASGNASFSHWTVSDPSALWVIKPTGSITKLVVNSTGTVTAVYASATGYNVTFQINPPGAGVISFNGVTSYASNATNRSVGYGAYLLAQTTELGYHFLGWSVTGGLSVAPGILTVHGNGTLTADYVVRPFPVTFIGSANGVLSGTIGGVPVTSGTTLYFARGNYSASVSLGPNSTFVAWSSNLPVQSPTTLNTVFTVNGAGTLSALAAGFRSVAVSSSAAQTEVGFPVTFTASVAGSGPFAYSWPRLPSGCASRNTARLVCDPSTAGTFPVSVDVTGASGFSEFGHLPGNLTVQPPLSVSTFTASPATVDIGQPVALTVTTSGGVGPNTYSYSALPPGCASANSSTLSCSPTASATDLVQVHIQDSLGAVANAEVLVTVAAPFAVSTFTVAPGQVTQGMAVTFSATVAGGQAGYTYTYSGLPPGCALANAPTIQCTPTHSGSYPVSLVVHDRTGAVALANVTLQVNPPPTIASFTSQPGTTTVGQLVTFVVNATGGTGALTVSYAGLPAGCTSRNVTVLACTAVASGSFRVTATVTDADGVQANATTHLTVNPPTSTSGGSPGPGGTNWALIVGLAAVVALAGVGLFWYSFRRRRATAREPAEGGR